MFSFLKSKYIVDPGGSEVGQFEPSAPLQIAVLFLVFNRPDTTAQVFEAIRKAKPPRLYVAADGGRKEREGESEKVAKVRQIATNVDWPCVVKTLFRDENLGCKYAVSGAITWFFENEEQGIILEDDCLPSQSFFWFCEELLIKYKNNPKIMHVAGMTYVEKTDNTEQYSYHFARVGGIWGWASWRRAWNLYELEMTSYPQAIQENLFDDLFVGEKEIKELYLGWFKEAYQNTHTWDFQWTYTKIINNSINIMPAKNLIRNIGHGADGATHTTGDEDKYSNMPLNEITFPLKHPKFLVIDRKFNYMNFKYITQRKLYQILYYYMHKFLPDWSIKMLKTIKYIAIK
jgi:hypothetical protein